MGVPLLWAKRRPFSGQGYPSIQEGERSTCGIENNRRNGEGGRGTGGGIYGGGIRGVRRARPNDPDNIRAKLPSPQPRQNEPGEARKSEGAFFAQKKTCSFSSFFLYLGSLFDSKTIFLRRLLWHVNATSAGVRPRTEIQ